MPTTIPSHIPAEKILMDARLIHTAWQRQTVFAHWIKRRIEEAGLVENEDYGVFANSGKNPLGGRPSTEYWLTAEAISMIAQSEKDDLGKQFKRFFHRKKREAAMLRRGQAIDFSNPVETAQLVVNLGNQLLAKHGLLIETKAELAEAHDESADRPARQPRQPGQRCQSCQRESGTRQGRFTNADRFADRSGNPGKQVCHRPPSSLFTQPSPSIRSSTRRTSSVETPWKALTRSRTVWGERCNRSAIRHDSTSRGSSGGPA